MTPTNRRFNSYHGVAFLCEHVPAPPIIADCVAYGL
jgi:hypothetical protein